MSFEAAVLPPLASKPVLRKDNSNLDASHRYSILTVAPRREREAGVEVVSKRHPP